MIGSVAPLLLALAVWTQDPPAPAPAPELPPWGKEGFGLTTNSPVWRGAFFSIGVFSGSDLEMNAPLAVETRSDGVNPVQRVEFEYDEMEFEAVSLSVAFDFDVFRLSASFFTGDFEATGELRFTDGLNPAASTSTELDGDFFGVRVGGYWPALRYRGGVFEASIGPELSVGWFHSEADVTGSPLPYDDTLDQLIGTFGPRLSVRVFIGRFALSAEATGSLLFGHSRGFVEELTFGIGYKF